MTKIARVLRSRGPVTETEANSIFKLLIPIVENDTSAEAAVDAARDVIGRFGSSEDRHLSQVLDWWFVATTGEPSVNGGAHRLPENMDDFSLRQKMESVIGYDLKVPAAEWLKDSQDLKSLLPNLDEALGLTGPGSTQNQGGHDEWSWKVNNLSPTAERLKKGKPADAVEIDDKEIEKFLREKGLDPGTRRFKKVLKSCQEATDRINRRVRLQKQVEPWKDRPTPTPVSEVPDGFRDAVGPLADSLLRPLLTHNIAPAVDKETIRQLLDGAGKASDRKGRYKLARIVDSWCAETGQAIPSLGTELERHRKITEKIEKLKDEHPTDVDEVRFFILDDDIEQATQALTRLEEKIARTKKRELALSQIEGLKRKLRDSTLSDDEGWKKRIEEIKGHSPESDPDQMIREVSAAHTELSKELDELIHAQQQDLKQLLDPLRTLKAPELSVKDYERKIEELNRRGGRGANDLKEEIEAKRQELREDLKSKASKNLEQLQGILTGERYDFSGEDRGDFANRRAEITVWLGSPDIDEEQIVEANEKSGQLLAEVNERRIHRWLAEEGEHLLVDHLLDHCKGPLDFDEVDIRRLYVSLKTRPFVILAGLTGSGKSSLTRSFARAFGANGSNGRFKRIAVRPDWIDQSEVLGFVNPISENFVPGWLSETIRDCERDANRMHFVLLDEMNLAPVEQYLAEWLSAIEEARSGSDEVRIPLYSSSMSPENRNEWPSSLNFPNNLMIIGTVNVDETTRPLSERVLDRANVLLLSVKVSDAHHHPKGEKTQPWHVELSEWQQVCATEPANDHHEFLIDIADILRQASIGVGLRAHLELERFVANARDVLDEESALDWGIVQRIIPKIRGYKGHLSETLTELLKELKKVGAHQSAAIVGSWLSESRSDDEYLDGTDPRLALYRI